MMLNPIHPAFYSTRNLHENHTNQHSTRNPPRGLVPKAQSSTASDPPPTLLGVYHLKALQLRVPPRAPENIKYCNGYGKLTINGYGMVWVNMKNLRNHGEKSRAILAWTMHVQGCPILTHININAISWKKCKATMYKYSLKTHEYGSMS